MQGVMATRWYYWHEKLIFGPVAEDELRRLAAAGLVLPDDLLWPEYGNPRDAVELRTAVDFSALPPRAGIPDWLGDVQTGHQSPASTGKVLPDWLTDVEPVAPAKSAAPVPAPQQAAPVLQANVPTTQSPAQGPPHVRLGGASSVGLVRKRNEDRFLAQHWSWNDGSGAHEVALLIVADGMGGYEGGDEASTLTVRTVAAQLTPLVITGMSASKTEVAAIGAALDQALREANTAVRRRSDVDQRFKGMGATVAVVVIWDGHACIGHVGDCRVYLHRGSELKQLTEDQTLVARMVTLGQLTAEEAAQHENRNEVAQAIGKRSTVEPSRAEVKVECGDCFLLACDGLAAHVDQTMLQKVVNESSWDAFSLASHLVGLADAGGGTDNCTVVVGQYS
jgi:protein phosphatase